jgi:hypothetical protein
MTTDTDIKTRSLLFTRVFYILMIVTAIALWLLNDRTMAICSFTLALAFDPFDPTVSWKQRPLYQRIIPIAQLGIAAAALGYIIAT